VVIPVTPEARAHALFASYLQPSDAPSAVQVADAIRDSVRRHGGSAGCVALVAAAYGEHPELAVTRMRWALQLTAQPAIRRPAVLVPRRVAGRSRATARQTLAASA
jgi:hypothetical protein